MFDPTLVKIVHREKTCITHLVIFAMISRFGGFEVLIDDTETHETVWQGDNILDARDWILGKAQGDF